MPKIASVLLAFALLPACIHARPVIPDPTVVHRVAREAEVVIWVRRPDGQLVPQKVRIEPGWWIAGPPVVEPLP